MLKPFYAVAVIAAVSAPMAAFAAGEADKLRERGISVVPDNGGKQGGGAQTFLVAPPQGNKPAGDAGAEIIARPNIGENFLVRPPEGTKPAGNGGGQNAGGGGTGQVFVVRPPEGNTPAEDTGGQNAGGGGTGQVFVVRPPEGNKPAGNAGSIVTAPQPAAPSLGAVTLPQDLGNKDVEAPAGAETADRILPGTASAADLYQALIDRGFSVSILRHDENDRYVFLISQNGARQAYLALVDGPTGALLEERTIGITGHGIGHGHRYGYSTAPTHGAQDHCRKSGKVRYTGYGHGSSYAGWARY